MKELEEHYDTAKANMMLAARTKPIHGESGYQHTFEMMPSPRKWVFSLNPLIISTSGVLSALQSCLLEAPDSVYDTLDHGVTAEVLGLLENISLLLLGVLQGDHDACATEKGNVKKRQKPFFFF